MRSLLLLLAAVPLIALAAPTTTPVADRAAGDESAAQRLVALATRQDTVAETDPRVQRASGQLAKAIRNTGETETAIATACIRAARFLFDATRAQATALEVLDAVAEKGAGRPLSDTIGRYVEARRNTKGKTHAEAMGALK